ncbi:hypothetical protein V6N12_049887 [Hibiscus sabdariffa]|uniref:RNase H type-1 domain-containing protein n=1 Tax=Hibiscus sabdariffa TaxID=183260 RepID=A0ABR2GAU5_9ROSI
MLLHIEELTRRSWNVRFQHVGRYGNKVANAIMRGVVAIDFEIHLIDSSPTSLSSLLAADDLMVVSVG